MPVRPLSEELHNRTISDLNEVPSRLQNDIDHIIKWISQQPHLIARIDDQWIVAFLRACKFSLQKVKEKIDSYYTLRSISPEIFKNRDPALPEIQEVFKRNIFAVLPRESNALAPRTTITIFKYGDPNTVPVTDILKVITMRTDTLLFEDDAFIINGQNIIIDLGDIPYNYAGQLGPRTLKTVVTLLQSSYPLNIKGLYFLNAPSFFQAIINVFVSLLSEKIKSRVHFYSRHNYDELYKSIPKSILPKEYGGEAGPLSELSKKAITTLEKHCIWFKEDSKYGTDETKRSGKSKLSSEFHGIEGSFRKLDID